jgi:co-chaperonin GroES (HSP10)
VTTAKPIKKLSPTGDRVLVLMDPEPKVVRGIIVSAGKPAPQNLGVVVAVGPRVKERIATGDRVLWSRWHAQDVEIGGVVHKLMREDEVMAVLSTKESA